MRRRAWDADGWFVALEVAGLRDFWETALQGFLDAMEQRLPEGMRQGDAVLARLAGPGGAGWRARLPAWLGWRGRGVSAAAVLQAARKRDPARTTRHRDVVSAFTRLFGQDDGRRDLAQAWLLGAGLDEGERRSIGVRAAAPSPRATLEAVSWLMSLSGPTLCAVDQLDAVVAAGRGGGLIETLSGGLMDLRDVTRRTLTVVSTLEATWDVLRRRSVDSFEARFRSPMLLPALVRPRTARELIERRLAPAYAAAAVAPPYATWPFHPAAFEEVVQDTPRLLLMRCHRHVEACLAVGRVFERTSFNGLADAAPPRLPAEGGAAARYASLVAAPPPAPPPAQPEPARLAELLLAGLKAWHRQAPDDEAAAIELDPEPPPTLGARLRIDGSRPLQLWLRLIPQPSAQAVLPALRKALTDSGIARDQPSRRLAVLRAAAWPTGARTEQVARDFEARGGLRLMPDEDDLRRFAAIEKMLLQPPPDLDSWLRAARPMDASPFLRRIGLIGEPDVAAPPPPAPPPVHPLPAPERGAERGMLPLGVRTSDGEAVALPLEMLKRHVAVIAGSGSGKTVLLRRIAEEAALAGIPVILIDSNNDLVRMADAWPAAPAGFSDEDRRKAARFQAAADVVVWTPGRAQGNPLVLAPLPDFAAVRGDADELEAAIGVAAAALEPLLSLTGKSSGVPKGVLRDALRHMARGAGPSSLEALKAMLRDFPPEASEISQASRIAPKLADLLESARSRNPLLSQAGTPLDPATLLGGGAGKVRVSVVNLSGLPDEATREDFVGRLLMALFGYARRHPAREGLPASSLLVMDEAHLFAPSGRGAASGAAAKALARQARKYGLGLVFATQAPRDIDHGVVNNCATKLIGRLNSPTAIQTAAEWLESSGGAPADLARLDTGQFYLATEGLARPVKISAPLCLTHHPSSPPSEAEVTARAAASRPVHDSPV
jgi:hypothetical protein